MVFALPIVLLSPIVLGFLIVRSLSPARQPGWAGFVLNASLGTGLGAGVSSLLYFLVWLLIGPSNAAYITAEIALLTVASVGCWMARSRSPVSGMPAAPGGWTWLLLAALVVALGLSLTLFISTVSSNPYGTWDAFAIWNLRAKILAQHDASWRNAFSAVSGHLAGGHATHGDYPLMLSAYIARCWSLLGSVDDVTPPIVTAGLFSFGIVGLMVAGLAILRGWSAAMMGGLVLLGTGGYLFESPSQFADVPLGFYYLAVFVLLFLFDAEPDGRRATAVLVGLAAGCAAWTKDEGMLFAILAIMALAAYLYVSKKDQSVRTLALFMAGAFPLAAAALYFKIFLAPKGIWAPVTPSSIAHKLMEPGRYVQIVKAFWEEGLAQGTGLAHPAVCLAVLAVCLGVPRARLRRPILIASAGAWLAIFLAYFFSYLVTPLDLAWHLGTSLDRLLVQLVPSAIFLAMAVFRTAEETAISAEPEKAARVSRKKARRMQAAKG